MIGNQPSGGGHDAGGVGGNGEGVSDGVGGGVWEIADVTIDVAAKITGVSDTDCVSTAGIIVAEAFTALARKTPPSAKESTRLPITNTIERSAASTPRIPWRTSARFKAHHRHVQQSDHWIVAAIR